jgi:hypothetical protein
MKRQRLENTNQSAGPDESNSTYAVRSGRTKGDRDGDEGTRPLAVRAEFIVVGGREGEALEARQLAVIQEILQWLHQNRSSVPQDE